jgi:hypothetical protein
MEHTKQLAELARCIEEHNTLTRQAHDLWGRAQAESRRIGQLVEAVLSTGVLWAELGALLSGLDEAPPPPGLAAGVPASVAPAAEKNVYEEADTRTLVPAQGAGASPRLPTGELVPEGTPACCSRHTRSFPRARTRKWLHVISPWRSDGIPTRSARICAHYSVKSV